MFMGIFNGFHISKNIALIQFISITPVYTHYPVDTCKLNINKYDVPNCQWCSCVGFSITSYLKTNFKIIYFCP